MNNILINKNFFETRVAIVKDGNLENYFIENFEEISLVGNVYKAKVERVLPGIQSAFLDIGLDKSAFLHFKKMYIQKINKVDNSINIENPKIEDVLKSGDELIVQVVKDPISTKGPRVESLIAIPGRFVVFFPLGGKLGVSKKISSLTERKRLKNIASSLKPNESSLIVRTVANEVSKEILEKDILEVINTWKDIVIKQKNLKAPEILLKELSLPLRIIRDYLEKGDNIVVNDKQLYNEIYSLLEDKIINKENSIEYLDNKKNIFSMFELEKQIRKLDYNRIFLKSGGDIIIEQVEALTVVDVNTGKFIGKNLEHEDMILKNNLEAIEVILEQIKLRNIGGIIIVDFVDMDSDDYKQKLIEHGMEIAKKDKAQISILGITELGLMQITRKRISDSLGRKNTTTCHLCKGKGVLRSNENITSRIYREILNYKDKLSKSKLIIFTNKDLNEFITSNEKNNLDKLMEKYDILSIESKIDDSLNFDSFYIKIK